MEETKTIDYLKRKKELLFGSAPFDQKIIENLLLFPDDKTNILEKLPLHKPSIAKGLAKLFGFCGIDCFYLGNILRGYIKCFTFGGLGILWFKDAKNAEKKCRAYNRKMLLKALKDPSAGEKMIEKSKKTKKFLAIFIALLPALVKGFKDIGDSMEVK